MKSNNYTFSWFIKPFVCLIFFIALTINASGQVFLKASGSKITDPNGNEVILKGMGLGGWFLMEGYMLQVDGSYGQWQIKRDMYLKGATEEEIENFFSSWRSNHTTSADITYLKSLGLNCVRVPMHYELFLTPAQRSVRNDVIYNKTTVDSYVESLSNWYDQNVLFTDVTADGFTTIDNVLQWLGANNMWAILDLHAAPGGQGSQISINDALVGMDLWNRVDSKGRKIYQLITARLWKALSDRYKSDARVAMYDLINEPHGGVQNSTIKALYDNLIATIRNNGDNHLILLEGNGYGNEYTGMTPDLFPGQTNLVWNGHRYWVTNDPTVKDRNANQLNLIANLVNFKNKWNVPVWVGETGENSNHWVSVACKNLNDVNIGWCLWTNKRLHGANSPLAQTASPLKVKYADIYSSSGRTALLTNVLHANCIKQNDYIDAMTRMINDTNPLPYGGTRAAIPGKIFASNFDIGRQGIAYNDKVYEKIPYDGEDWNSGYTFRNDGVDIEVSQDATGNGVNVGWLEYQEWMNYSINVTQSGSYTAQLRVANGGKRSAGLTLKIDGNSIGAVSIAPTGDYQNWTTITLSSPVNLTSGNHTLQVMVNARSGGGNLSWINFSPTSARLGATEVDNHTEDYIVSPNPANNKLNISYQSEIVQTVSVIVRNIYGQILEQKEYQAGIGNNQLELNTTQFSEGVYFISFKGKNTLSKRVTRVTINH